MPLVDCCANTSLASWDWGVAALSTLIVRESGHLELVARLTVMVRTDGSCLDRGQTFFGDLVSLAFLYLVVKIGMALMNAGIIG